MKKLTLFLIIILCFSLFSISDSEFVLNIMQEYPVREFDNKVAIHFDTEYELLLKNNNERDCSARIWIDGSLVSELGDFIIRAGDELNLERFVSESLREGKRFKFVPLSHPEVDDPSREENGIVKVEFRLAKKYEHIVPEYKFPSGHTLTCVCDTQAGATIGGSESNQTFYYQSFDAEEEFITLELRIVGIK